jgi:glycerate 2-kinase
MIDDPRGFLRELFDAAIASAQPSQVLAAYLPEKPRGRCVVVGAGKASAAMAQALERAWPDVAMTGVVVTRYGHAAPTQKIKVIEASHPVPDENSVRAADEILDAVRGLAADDLVIALISGGGSALLVAPLEGLTLANKQAVNKALLHSGANITEMNVVRKHLSRIKGGKLARAAAPARVVTLLISDVPGDDPAVIASGPTVPDSTTPQDALAVLARYQIEVPANLQAALSREMPQPVTIATDIRMIASPMLALKAAAQVALTRGVHATILGDALEGEAGDLGKDMADMAIFTSLTHPASLPCVLLSGGETTVIIGNGPAGRGGRNTEFLLAAALGLQGRANIWALAGDTDGIDGTEVAAGAIIGPHTGSYLEDAALYLARHDSYSFFEKLGDLVVTGPTLTNVNDFRALLIDRAG